MLYGDEIAALLLIGQGIVFGAFCAWIAKEKNRVVANWFLIGFLFSIVGLIAVACAPKVEKEEEQDEEDEEEE